jgi:hypothetical protein
MTLRALRPASLALSLLFGCLAPHALIATSAHTTSSSAKGRAGYVVDHIVPLACGGADAPSNIQWQKVADAKAKDKGERVGCK